MHTETNPHHEKRWLILAVIAIAQLMVVLDVTIVNIALPSAQEDLGFSNDARQWIVTAYALAFGSLLLLGGRIGDLFGRKWTFIAGLLGFAVASAIGGAAGSFGVLVAARALQGVFAALLAPSALALLSTIFTDRDERAKAFGIYGAIAGGGAAVGLLLGGILTETLSWRWCLYVNLAARHPDRGHGPAAPRQPAAPGAPLDRHPGHADGHHRACSRSSTASRAPRPTRGAIRSTIVMLAAAVVLLSAFVVIESRVAHPLLPLRVIADRVRGGAYLAIGIAGIAMFAVFLFLTYYLQQTLGFSPIESGLAFLPMTAAIIVTATSVNIRFLSRVGPRPLLILGMVLGSAAMVLLAQLETDSSYVGHVLPALIVMGVGMGNIFAPAFATATYGVDPRDSGVASAMVNTMQQVGGSIGTALLSSIFASAVSSYVDGRAAVAAGAGRGRRARVHGRLLGRRRRVRRRRPRGRDHRCPRSRWPRTTSRRPSRCSRTRVDRSRHRRARSPVPGAVLP